MFSYPGLEWVQEKVINVSSQKQSKKKGKKNNTQALSHKSVRMHILSPLSHGAIFFLIIIINFAVIQF